MRTIFLLLIGFSLNAQIIQTNWSVEHPMNCAYPLYSTGQQCLVNSHAIAIAQLINYHGHPEYPFLNNCYNSNVGYLCSEGLTILFDDTLLASSTILEIDISCQSSYSPYPLAWNCGLVDCEKVKYVLREHYGYQCRTDSLNAVLSDLKQNIRDSRPFIAETYPYNYGCSRFVLIDGYDSITDKWHCNWGWGWQHNYQWQSIDSLYFAGQYYGKNTKVVYNIVPDSITVTGWLVYDGSQDTIPGYITYDQDTVQSGHPYTIAKGVLYAQGHTQSPWGHVNSTDALLILKHFVGISTLVGLRKEAADVNMDLYINSVDALYAARRFVGQLLTFGGEDYIFEPKELTTSQNYTIFVRCKGDVSQ